jgi:hypothetical protein
VTELHWNGDIIGAQDFCWMECRSRGFLELRNCGFSLWTISMVHFDELAKFSYLPFFLIFDPNSINHKCMLFLELQWFIYVLQVISIGIDKWLRVLGDRIQNDMHELDIERWGEECRQWIIYILLRYMGVFLTHHFTKETAVPLCNQELEIRLSYSDHTHD